MVVNELLEHALFLPVYTKKIKRIQKRDNCSKEEALSRISSQISQEDKVKYADYVLDNSGDLEELKEKTKEFLLYMKENWRG